MEARGKGEKVKYIAKTEFEVGIDSDDSIPVAKKQVVKFDGVTAEIGGTEYDIPKLDSAIDAGWLVPIEQFRQSGQREYRSPSAEVEVSPAENPGGEKSTYQGDVDLADEEKMVGEVDEHERLREDAKEAYRNEDVDQPDPQRMQHEREQKRRKRHQADQEQSDDGRNLGADRLEKSPSRDDEEARTPVSGQRSKKGREVQSDQTQETPTGQEGEVVAEDFQFSANSETTVSADSSPESIEHGMKKKQKQSAERRLQDIKSKSQRQQEQLDQRTGKRATEEPIDDVPESGAQTMESPGDLQNTVTSPEPSQIEEQDRQVEDRTTSQTDESDRRIKTGEPVSVDVEPDDDLDPETKAGRYKIAETVLDTTLPDLDFDEHWASRFKQIREDERFQDNPDAVRAAYAAESEGVKKKIKEHYDEYFA